MRIHKQISALISANFSALSNKNKTRLIECNE